MLQAIGLFNRKLWKILSFAYLTLFCAWYLSGAYFVCEENNELRASVTLSCKLSVGARPMLSSISFAVWKIAFSATQVGFQREIYGNVNKMKTMTHGSRRGFFFFGGGGKLWRVHAIEILGYDWCVPAGKFSVAFTTNFSSIL